MICDRIIFLDIDGVICTIRKGFRDMDKKPMRWLALLLWITNAKIVISSAWRTGELGLTKSRMLERGFMYNWHHRIIGETPDGLNYRDRDSYHSVCRGQEIKHWLYTNGFKYDFKDYVILDDDSNMLHHQRDNYVRTNCYFGLSFYTFLKSLYVFYFPQKQLKRIRWKLLDLRLKVFLFLKPNTLKSKSEKNGQKI